MSSSLLSQCPTPTRPSKSRMDSSSVKTKNKNKNKKDKTDSAASSTATPAPTAGDKKRATPTRLTCKTCIAAEHLPLRPHGPSITKTVPLNTGCDEVTLRNLQLLTGTLEVHENPALAADIKFTDMVQRGQWIHQFKRGSDQIVCQVTQHKFGEYFFSKRVHLCCIPCFEAILPRASRFSKSTSCIWELIELLQRWGCMGSNLIQCLLLGWRLKSIP